MIAQTPAEGISVDRVGLNGSGLYSVKCWCGDHEHSCQIDIEYQKDFGPEISFYVTLSNNYWSSFFSRFKDAVTVLFTGKIKLESTILLTPQQALNIAEVLKKPFIKP